MNLSLFIRLMLALLMSVMLRLLFVFVLFVVNRITPKLWMDRFFLWNFGNKYSMDQRRVD